MQLQGQLGFADTGPDQSHSKWLKDRQRAVKAVSQKPALAVGHPPAIQPLQGEIGFTGRKPEEGYTQWVAVRQLAVEAAAQKLNLPLGHLTEIWLRGGIRLRGSLRLAHEVLYVEEERIRSLALVLDGVAFTYSEIESCVRLD
jgi:hypothetical protein